MAKIEVDGRKYTVTDSLGFVHSVGMYVKEVQTEDGFKMVVKDAGRWRFWTAQERVKPLKDWCDQQRKYRNLLQLDYGFRGYTS